MLFNVVAMHIRHPEIVVICNQPTISNGHQINCTENLSANTELLYQIELH